MELIRIEIPYGDGKCEFTVPGANFGELLSANPVSVPSDPISEIRQALDTPFGTPCLAELARGRENAIILCDDLTRPIPAHEILPILLAQLNDAGLPDSRITIMMALGTHRPMTDEEIIIKVGKSVFDRVGVLNSEFHDKKALRFMGDGSGGVPLWIDERVVRADLKIGVGTILPHPAAGWGGGGKIIYPGVAGEETVRVFHLKQGETPRNLFGVPDSPVRLNMEKWVDAVGLDFIVNVIFTPQGEIYRVVAGHYVQAHRQGVRYASEVYAVEVAERADIVVISSHPADLDLWQATKALCGGEHIVRDGGTLILVTPCPEGIGPHKELAEYLGAPDVQRLLEEVRSARVSEPIAAAGAATLVRMRQRISFALVSDGLSDKDAASMRFDYFSSVQEAVDSALRKYGSDARVSVIPYGAEILPYVAD